MRVPALLPPLIQYLYTNSLKTVCYLVSSTACPHSRMQRLLGRTFFVVVVQEATVRRTDVEAATVAGKPPLLSSPNIVDGVGS